MGENMKKEDFLTKSVMIENERKPQEEIKETYFKVRK